VLRHVVESISPASAAHAEGARQRVHAAGAPSVERLAALLGGAQHTARPRTARRAIVVALGDHGAGDPGIALGASHPTVVAARAIDAGEAALAHLARQARAPIVLVDAGTAEPAHLPASVIRLGRGPSAATPPALTVVEAALLLEAGIALATSLAEPGLDLVALGAVGLGAELAAAALAGAAIGGPPPTLGDPGAEAAWARGAAYGPADPLARLAEFGGPDTALLAGLILACASTNIAVILDSYATGAAALAACAFAPAAAGSLVAAHAGSGAHGAILAHLGLVPLFAGGLGHGEGTGAALALPLADQVAVLAE
jgi:nicotinate-nucleotide--dimethylbenzimidazole phosphoribosyltransferase